MGLQASGLAGLQFKKGAREVWRRLVVGVLLLSVMMLLCIVEPMARGD